MDISFFLFDKNLDWLKFDIGYAMLTAFIPIWMTKKSFFHWLHIVHWFCGVKWNFSFYKNTYKVSNIFLLYNVHSSKVVILYTSKEYIRSFFISVREFFRDILAFYETRTPYSIFILNFFVPLGLDFESLLLFSFKIHQCIENTIP